MSLESIHDRRLPPSSFEKCRKSLAANNKSQPGAGQCRSRKSGKLGRRGGRASSRCRAGRLASKHVRHAQSGPTRGGAHLVRPAFGFGRGGHGQDARRHASHRRTHPPRHSGRPHPGRHLHQQGGHRDAAACPTRCSASVRRRSRRFPPSIRSACASCGGRFSISAIRRNSPFTIGTIKRASPAECSARSAWPMKRSSRAICSISSAAGKRPPSIRSKRPPALEPTRSISPPPPIAAINGRSRPAGRSISTICSCSPRSCSPASPRCAGPRPAGSAICSSTSIKTPTRINIGSSKRWPPSIAICASWETTINRSTAGAGRK